MAGKPSPTVRRSVARSIWQRFLQVVEEFAPDRSFGTPTTLWKFLKEDTKRWELTEDGNRSPQVLIFQKLADTYNQNSGATGNRGATRQKVYDNIGAKNTFCQLLSEEHLRPLSPTRPVGKPVYVWPLCQALGLERPVSGTFGEPEDPEDQLNSIPSFFLNAATFFEKSVPELMPRNWLTDKIDELVRERDGQITLIKGIAGIGKTCALSAWTRETKVADVVAKHSFRSYERPDSLRARPFVSSLIRQLLEANFLGYRQELGRVVYLARQLHGDQWFDADAATLIDRFVVAPLTALAVPDVLFAITLDGLDEAKYAASLLITSGEGDKNPSLDILAVLACLRNLPSWMRVVATSQPDVSMDAKATAVFELELGARNYQDLRMFALRAVEQTLASAGKSSVLAETVTEDLLRRVPHTFLCVSSVAHDQEFLESEVEVKSVSDYYERYLSIHIGPEAYHDLPSALLSAMVAADSSVGVPFLTGIANTYRQGTNHDEVRRVLESLSGVVVTTRSGKYRIRHRIISEWLQGNTVFRASRDRGETLLAAYVERLRERLPAKTFRLFLGCSVSAGTWSIDDLCEAFGDSFDDLEIVSYVRRLGDEGAIEMSGGTESRRFSIVSGLRDKAFQILMGTGDFASTKKTVDDMVETSLERWASEPMESVFSKNNRDLEFIYSDPARLAEVIQSSSEERRTLLLFQSMVGGKAYILLKAFPPEIWLRPRQMSAAAIVARGIYHYSRGEYEKTLEYADEAIRRRSEVDPWMVAVAKSTATLVKVLLDQDIDFVGEFNSALQEIEPDAYGGIGLALYWFGIMQMQLGTAYWHRMRPKRSALGSETRTAELDLAINQFSKAAYSLGKFGDVVFLSLALNSLGHLYRLRSTAFPGDAKISLDSYEKSLFLAESIRNERGQLGAVHGIAGWMGWLGMKDQFETMMDIVESLYVAHGQHMPIPIRREYDLLWSKFGVRPTMAALTDPEEALADLVRLARRRMVYLRGVARSNSAEETSAIAK